MEIGNKREPKVEGVWWEGEGEREMAVEPEEYKCEHEGSNVHGIIAI